jgi:hypothetical protein
MKKVIATVLTMGLALSMAACGSKTAEGTQDAATEAVSEVAEEVSEAAQEVAEDASDAAEEAVEEVVEEATEGEEATEEAAGDVMTHDDYVAAELDSEVTVETYVQAKQGWWENEGVGNATFYTQAEDGAYFIYNMPCSEEEYEQLTPGTKIKVTGYKSEWSGEVEITDAKFEIEDGNFVAEALDVTDLLADDAIIDHQNEFVAFKGMTVEASKDADGNDVAFLYNYDGSGSQGDDLYFNVSANGTTYTFTVESYLCGQDSDVYKAVEGLNVGDTVDMEGFLYWYEGVNPHITSVSVQ